MNQQERAYMRSLKYWSRQFNDGKLPDKFAESIAKVLDKEAKKLHGFDHVYDFSFLINSQKADASDVTPAMVREACVKRINDLCDVEIFEACTLADDLRDDFNFDKLRT